MKKIILILAFLVMSSYAFAVTVDRSMPQRADPSSTFTVSFTVNPEGALSAFDMADFVPDSWKVKDWSVSGYSKSDVSFESQVREYQSKQRNGLHWKFSKNLTGAVTLAYTMDAPAAAGTYEFIAVWTYPGGFGSRPAVLAVGKEVPSLAIASPSDSQTLYDTKITVALSVGGVKLAAPTGAVAEGEGHLHVWLDGANEQRGPRTSFTFENVQLGAHTIRAELHRGDHSAFDPAVVSTVTFTVAERPPAPTTPTEPETPTEKPDYTAVGVIVIVLVIAAGYFFFVKGRKPRSSVGAERAKYEYRPRK